MAFEIILGNVERNIFSQFDGELVISIGKDQNEEMAFEFILGSVEGNIFFQFDGELVISTGKHQNDRLVSQGVMRERGALEEGLCPRNGGVGAVHGVVAALVGWLMLCHGECEKNPEPTP